MLNFTTNRFMSNKIGIYIMMRKIDFAKRQRYKKISFVLNMCKGGLKLDHISEFDRHIFHEGKHYEVHKFMGAHVSSRGTTFTVWAPHAKAVSVVGDFNNWSQFENPMKKISIEGLWSIFVENVYDGERYKYHILTSDNKELYKADPYAFYAEQKPKTASVTYDLENYTWSDKKWMKKRKKWDFTKEAISIYEINFASWKKNEDGSFYTYGQFADELIPYIKELGYTHIEIMPLHEHPFDGSWGYQVTGYYAITSRYGSPKDFMNFVDLCHQNEIGVILDWVPSHFCKDEHGLASFDGSNLYECDDEVLRENRDWGTLNFNYERNEVKNFLISNAIFLLEKYHIDGLRVDAVAYMMYKNMATSRYDLFEANDINEHAVKFIKQLNIQVFERFSDVLMIAEESSPYVGVTSPVHKGGLGFNLKWNMGWMNDTLKYIELDPLFKSGSHSKLTFSIMYAFNENFVLPLSHDEVVHGKKSLLDKMPGDYNMKFSGLKLLLSYMFFHPGKKLTFMGTEFGQFIEWDEWKELDWHLYDYDSHKSIYNYLKKLNYMYKKEKTLHEIDFKYDGFKWNDADNRNESIIAFSRFDLKGNHTLAVFNFTPVKRENYWIKIYDKCDYQAILCSDDGIYNGNSDNLGNEITYFEDKGNIYVSYDLPPLSATLLKPIERRKKHD